MDSDLIAFEAMIATRESALWMFWSMIGTVVSALATLAAAIFAWRALSAWQHQEKRSDRKSLKIALVNYRNVLIGVPPKIAPTPKYAAYAFALTDAMNNIYEAMEVLEINDDDNPIGKKHNELINKQSEYLKGQIDVEELAIKTFEFLISISIDN